MNNRLLPKRLPKSIQTGLRGYLLLQGPLLQAILLAQ